MLKVSGSLSRSNMFAPVKASRNSFTNCNEDAVINVSNDCSGLDHLAKSADVESMNIVWHKCSVEKMDRQKLLRQKGCVVWITGLSGSGKSTLACAVSRNLHSRGKLTYILDGDNVRHGLNSGLTFSAEDRAENIQRIGFITAI